MTARFSYTDPDIEAAMFEISAPGIGQNDPRMIAYADTVGGAYSAYWILHKERGVQGTKVQIKNLKTNKIVWHD